MARDDRESGAGKQFFLVLLPIVLLLMLTGLAFFGERGIVHLIKLRNETAALQARVGELRKRNDELRREIKELTSKDGKAVEKIAREELGMVSEGEFVYKMAPLKKKAPAPGVAVPPGQRAGRTVLGPPQGGE
jgi:cell division protein FtsB